MNTDMRIKKQKDDKYLGLYSFVSVLFLFFFVRILVMVLTISMNSQPFLCYDDLYIYDKISNLHIYDIIHWFKFRNCYYAVCMYLNKMRFGSYITGARILNTVLWLATCYKIREITIYLQYPSKVRTSIFKFMMFAPGYILYSMAQLREVICTWGVCYLIWTFLKYEKERKINWITTAISAVIMFFTRTGIIEILAIVILIYKLRNGKLYIKFFLCLSAVFAGMFFLSNQDYQYVVGNKIVNYLQSESSLTGFLSHIEVRKITDIYKFVFLIPYVQIIPLPGAFENFYSYNSWSAWLSLTAGIQAFILPYFWIYVLRKKKNKEERVILYFYIFMVILLALAQPNNSRFFFFTTPIYFIFGIRQFMESICRKKYNLLLGILSSCLPYIYLII